tara:strand:- start:48 stop:524 length:477 start_codon:yes stop_codon:yes gene_type:complete
MKLLRETIRQIIQESTEEADKSIRAFMNMSGVRFEGTYGTQWNPTVGYKLRYKSQCPVYFKLEPWGVNTIYIAEVTIADPSNPGHYDEECENKGYATRAMKALIQHADKFETELVLQPDAFHNTEEGHRPDTQMLEAWYEKLGFEPSKQSDGSMVYIP